MVHCPIFLKKEQGISITELLIVVAFLAVLAAFLLIYLNPMAQMGKARDARRKSDLSKLKNVLEDYYNDNKCYPSGLGDLVSDYIGQVPTDPSTKQSYAYSKEGCDKYRIYVTLDYEKDPAIAEVGCQGGCGPAGICDYNYGVCSSNVGLEPCAAGGCTGSWWACQLGGGCNNYGPTPPVCTLGGVAYCNNSNCGIGCETQLPCR